MNLKILRTLLVLFSVTAVLFGCQSQDTQESSKNEENKISVIASFLPMYEFTKNVAGDRADVQLMVSEGQDAHHYEPSAQDVAAVNEADVFVYSSEEMEFWTKSLFNTIENDNLIIARAADGPGKSDTDSVQVEGVANHYHTGDEIELTAQLTGDADYDHWHWYQRANADEEWAAISGQGTETFTFEAPEESFEVQAVVYDNNHEVYAESEPVELHIDNHDSHEHEDEEHEDHSDAHAGEEISIAGLADHYHTGDVVTLVAESHEETDFEHWHWFIREDADQDWEAVPDQETERFEYKTTGESFEAKAVLYDNDNNVHAESSSVSVLIDDHENQDPHIWLDPVLAQDQVLAIRNALIEADPDGKEIYEENAEAFVEELKALDEEYRTTLEDAENRAFVVQHQAFGYLAERYDLEQIAIGGLSTEVEPSPSRIAEIGELVQEHNVPVIYYQQGASSSIAQTVVAETGTETAVLYDLEVLSEELLANDLGYLDAMRQNLKALQTSIY
nr:zinc ABC transporter substrate-binding protein [Terribacillus saccharophilus]